MAPPIKPNFKIWGIADVGGDNVQQMFKIRYPFFAQDVKGRKGEDQCVLQHSNR